MLQVDRGCCTYCKCFRGICSKGFRDVVQNVSSVLDVAHVSHICCNNMFPMFQLFQPYVAVHVFMFASCKCFILYCICFIHMLQIYIPNVSSVSYGCCIQVFHVAGISCYLESEGAQRVIEAWHAHQGMNHGELEADRQGAQRIGVRQMRCAAGPTVKAQRERGARAGQGK
jgi:hypothetical protein